jgi:hypothetical protein
MKSDGQMEKPSQKLKSKEFAQGMQNRDASGALWR